MIVNPGEWLSTTLQKCCKKHFNGYYYDQCLGKYPPTDGNCEMLLFYPDWHGSNEGCLDDGKYFILLLRDCLFMSVLKLFFFPLLSSHSYYTHTYLSILPMQAKSPCTCYKTRNISYPTHCSSAVRSSTHGIFMAVLAHHQRSLMVNSIPTGRVATIIVPVKERFLHTCSTIRGIIYLLL